MTPSPTPAPDAGTWSVIGVIRLLGLLLISLIFTSIMVQWSLMWGRLSHTPCFDDVNYLLDGLRRYYMLHEYDYGPYDYHSVGSWLAGIWTNPPHSPFSTYLAAVSYSILGMDMTSPYYGNVVIIFGLLWAVEYLTRGIGPLQRVLLVLLVLAFPLAALSVSEFRPDLAYSLAAAVGTVMLTRRPLALTPVIELLAAGVLFSLALVIKTTTFPLVIAVLGVSLFVSSLDQLWPVRRDRLAPLAWRWFWVLLPVLLIAVPFYAVSAQKIYNYLYGALVASGDLYVRQVTPLEKYTLYFYGSVLQEGLGRPWFMVPTSIVLLLVALGFGVRVSPWPYLRLLAPLAITYVILTLSPMKYIFAGAYFYWVLTLACVLILRDLWAACEAAPGRPPAYALFSIGLHIVAVVGILSWSPPVLYRQGNKDQAVLNAAARAEKAAVAKLADSLPLERPVSIFCPVALSAGIVPESIEYLLRLDGRNNITLYDNIHVHELDYQNRVYDLADYIVTTEGDNPHLFTGLKMKEKLDALNEKLETGDQFVMLGRWELPYGNSLMVWERIRQGDGQAPPAQQ